jgi:tetratricopeptide (TPR) repeat protein
MLFRYCLLLLLFSVTPLASIVYVSSPTLAQISPHIDRKTEANTLYQQGMMQFQSGDFNASLQTLQQLLNLYQNEEFHEPDQAESYGQRDSVIQTITTIYLEQENDQAVIQLYQQLLNDAQQRGDRTIAAIILSQASRYVMSSFEQESDHSNAFALRTLKRLLRLYQDENIQRIFPEESQRGKLELLQRIGVLYIRQGDHRRAASYYQQSHQIALDIGDRWLAMQILQDEITALINQQLYDVAIERLQDSLNSQTTASQQVNPDVARQNQVSILQ